MAKRDRFRPDLDDFWRKYIHILRGMSEDDAERMFSGFSGQGTFEQQGCSATAESPKSRRIVTLDQLLKHCQVDKELWDVERHVVNKWEVGAKQKDGSIKVEPLFQVKAWLKKNQAKEDYKFLQDEFIEKLKVISPHVRRKPYEFVEDAKMLEIHIPDAHLGKLAWGEEVGEDYNIKIAQEIYHNTVDKLITRSIFYPIEEIVFVVGSDFFNVDNMYNTTTKGTAQDEDTRWKKTMTKGVSLIIDNANKLKGIAPVKIKVIPGNHDEERSFYLGLALEMYFRNDENVDVDNAPKKRKYIEYGLCFLGLGHGDKIGEKEWHSICSVEAPEIWGRTKYREMHTGDKHHLSEKQKSIKVTDDTISKEYKGITHRIIRSLSATDAYHYSAGYVGGIRGAQAFLWDKKEGVVNVIHANL